jgi:hypothetical protein
LGACARWNKPDNPVEKYSVAFFADRVTAKSVLDSSLGLKNAECKCFGECVHQVEIMSLHHLADDFSLHAVLIAGPASLNMVSPKVTGPG